MKTPVPLLLSLLAVLCSLATPAVSAAQEAEIMAFLHETAGFSEKDLKKLNEGKAITRIMKTDDNREIMLVGAVRANAPAAFIMDRFAQVAILLDDYEGTLSVGQFGATPAVAAMATMQLPKDDVSDLKKCKPEHCDVKLPADIDVGKEIG